MLYYMDHYNDARQAVRESGVDMIVEKDESLVDAGKTAVMTMRWRPLVDRSKLELQQPEMHACQQ